MRHINGYHLSIFIACYSKKTFVVLEARAVSPRSMYFVRADTPPSSPVPRADCTRGETNFLRARYMIMCTFYVLTQKVSTSLRVVPCSSDPTISKVAY